MGLCSLPVIYLGKNYGGGNEDMVTSLKKSHAHTATLSAHSPAADHRQLTPPLGTPGHSRASLGQSLVGSLLLSPGPGAHKGLFVPTKSLFPQSCVSSGSSMVGLMVTSSKRIYAILMPGLMLWCGPRAPVPAADHCRPVPPQETLTHSSVSASLGPGVRKVCLSPLSISGGKGV